MITGKLEIIDKADEISDAIWKEVMRWDHFKKDTIGKQLCRAADSISANLSEGCGRYSYAERRRFAYYARGSLYETINWMEKSTNRGLVETRKGEQLLSEIRILVLRINAYIKTLKQQ